MIFSRDEKTGVNIVNQLRCWKMTMTNVFH